MLLCVCSLTIFTSLSVFCAASHRPVPRLKLTAKDGWFPKYKLSGENQRIELIQSTHNHTVYVGGHGRVFYLDFKAPGGLTEDLDLIPKDKALKQQRTFSIRVTLMVGTLGGWSSTKVPVFCEGMSEGPASTNTCGYDVTVLHEVDAGTLFICGTNGISPVCGHLSLETGVYVKYSAEGIGPVSISERAPSLYVGDELYTTAKMHNKYTGIRRHFGKRGNIWPRLNSIERRYVGLAMSPRPDQIQDKVYAFLSQKSTNEHPEVDPWVPMVTQVCRRDRGGPKGILQQSWTSHLGARLSCGIPDKNLYFNQLLDVAFLEGDTWRDSRVFALFSNGWNMTAVCVFTIGDIDLVFSSSNFKGHIGIPPSIRPGTCTEDSRHLPNDVLTLMSSYPEMLDWVKPEHKSRPLLVSHRHYRHIRVDQVHACQRETYPVLLLTLDSGAVHKMLGDSDEPFIIAELVPFANKTLIQSVLLHPDSKKMYVSSSSEVVELDLQDCRVYGQSCEDCIMARDPYCGWDGTQCTVASRATIQDIRHGNYLVCREMTRGSAAEDPIVSRHFLEVPPRARVYLKCPMASTYATYSWHHQGIEKSCLVAEDQCLLLIDSVTPEQAGMYCCMASEREYLKPLVHYELSIWSRADGLGLPTGTLEGVLLLPTVFFYST